VAAVFADPVFHESDDRVAKAKQRQMPQRTANDALERSARQLLLTSEGLRLPRLRFSREEARAIELLAPKKTFIRLDFAANRGGATSSALQDAGILHFATHTLINNQHPELSGIVLSLLDEHGKPSDGFLRLHEIYNLDIPADLVVLSSCESGLGKQVRGEGLIGFTRGFFYAGASRVLVTLWKVNDEATAAFMRHFYRQLLGNHLPPAAALQAAQASMRQSARWSSPYYWAGFVLQGEWQ
jgi:CHAT domain-containing protein